jgi:hypothetical protein
MEVPLEKPSKIVQAYGYLVCLVAVITFIICISILVMELINLGDPLRASQSTFGSRNPSLASFENYKMDIVMGLQKPESESKQSYLPDDQTLRAMYEAAKNEMIQKTLFMARRNIIVNVILILVCIALFTSHWLWMRRLNRATA